MQKEEGDEAGAPTHKPTQQTQQKTLHQGNAQTRKPRRAKVRKKEKGAGEEKGARARARRHSVGKRSHRGGGCQQHQKAREGRPTLGWVELKKEARVATGKKTEKLI